MLEPYFWILWWFQWGWILTALHHAFWFYNPRLFKWFPAASPTLSGGGGGSLVAMAEWHKNQLRLGGGNSNICYFHPWGNASKFDEDICFKWVGGWNHHLGDLWSREMIHWGRRGRNGWSLGDPLWNLWKDILQMVVANLKPASFGETQSQIRLLD